MKTLTYSLLLILFCSTSFASVKDLDVYTVNILDKDKYEAEVDVYTTDSGDVGQLQRQVLATCRTLGVKWNFQFGEQGAKDGGKEYRLEVKMQGRVDDIGDATVCLKSVAKP